MENTLLRYTSSSPPSYSDFARDCLAPNRPALLPARSTHEWGVFREWRLEHPAQRDGLPQKCEEEEEEEKEEKEEEEEEEEEEEGDAHPAAAAASRAPDELPPVFSVLQDKYGDHEVPVVQQTRDGRQEERTTKSLREAVAMMMAQAQAGRAGTGGSPVLYVKDWHLFRQEDMLRGRHSTASELYTVLPYFQDDWMNHPDLVRDRDDFRFCYAGQAGTQTPLHADVYQSYSWSTNLAGTKRWRMFPPHVARFLHQMDRAANDGRADDERHARVSPLARSVDELDELARAARLGDYFGPLRDQGHAGWPRWHLARRAMLEFEQQPGETVFVPSGWVHEVLNLTSCVSINHNWCNTFNLPALYRALSDEVDDLEHSMADVRQMLAENGGDDWRTQWVDIVQSVSQADLGWGWRGFWSMVWPNLRDADMHQHSKPDPHAFVRPRIRALLADFAARSDTPYLDATTRDLFHQCCQHVGWWPTVI